MTEQSSLVRTARNDQDMTRSFDLANQIAMYRKVLVENGVADQVADHMCVRLNEHLLHERFVAPQAERVKG